MRCLPCYLAAALLLVTACVATDDATPTPPAADDLTLVPPEIQAVPVHPTEEVCNGGRWRCFAQRRTDVPQFAPLAGGQGLGPSDLQSAYGLSATGGTGMTIAIVDAYHYANAESDLAAYRSGYGLPACTKANGCFKVINQTGGTTPPSAPPAGDDWTVEAALDLDAASAVCPNCKIILVEAADDQSDGLFIAQNAAATSGAVAVSNSWGGPESQGDNTTSYESYFAHPGVGFFVATGDSGYDDGGQGPDYPGTSANVTGVGGTTLTAASNARGWTESAWSSGGSACSYSVPKPSWQSNGSCSYKASSDVSAVGNPSTGISIYNANSGGWQVVGGTSAATPIVAGIYAATGHGSDAPSFAYAHTADYYDVTSGTNGSCGNVLCRAGSGWDGPSGVGTPNGALLGASAPTNQAPTVSITAPSSGAQVSPGFEARATATDDTSVAKVELRIDGALVGTDTSSPYSFTTSPDLGAGTHTLEARAYDGPGLTGTASISVTVVSNGGTPDAGPTGGTPDANTGNGGDPDAGPSGPGPDAGDPGGNGEGPGYVNGGCSTSGGSGAGALLIAMFGFVGLRRRRS